MAATAKVGRERGLRIVSNLVRRGLTKKKISIDYWHSLKWSANSFFIYVARESLIDEV